LIGRFAAPLSRGKRKERIIRRLCGYCEATNIEEQVMPTMQTVKDLATVAGIAIAAISLLFTAFNAHLTLKTTRARFWLDLRDRFARFDPVHINLRPSGAWTIGTNGPTTTEEWAQVEAYMGLFEHCELMLRDGLLDRVTFQHIYQYRVENLLTNQKIVQAKLIERGKSWSVFLELVSRFGLSDRVPQTREAAH
jgi:hypothetical protein